MIPIKISELPETTSIQDNDLLHVVQSGSNKKVQKSNLFAGLAKIVNNSFNGIYVLTQAEYDAIVAPDAGTLYFIKSA